MTGFATWTSGVAAARPRLSGEVRSPPIEPAAKFAWLTTLNISPRNLHYVAAGLDHVVKELTEAIGVERIGTCGLGAANHSLVCKTNYKKLIDAVGAPEGAKIIKLVLLVLGLCLRL